MGLFDKRDKKRGGKDDFDSPVEQIDLSSMPSQTAKPAEPAPPPATAKAEPAPSASLGRPADTAAAGGRTPKQSDGMPQIEIIPATGGSKVTPETDDYGIEKAIELMRTLPQENVELVVQVVKFSLESVGIKLPAIIEDAIRRQKDIQGRIGVLKGEISELEQEIKTRKDEIERLDADHKETSMVRDRLELAENIGKPRPAPSPSSPGLPGMTPASSAEIPRVTRQTNPPPLGSPLSSSPSSPGAPIKK
jgi:hypothetical protein